MAAYISFQPSDYFSTLLYTGTGSSLGVTGVGFQPDFTWIKQRNGTSNHYLADAVRGAGKYVESSTTIAEVTNVNGLSAFNADGFTVGTQGAQVNGSSDTYASWNWKAGTTSGIAGSPSITPTAYSFNQTAGFSIITYTGNGTSGATIPHGLGAAPKMVIIKGLSNVDNWPVGHDSIGWTKWLKLDTTAAQSTATIAWNDTAPSSTLVTLGNNAISNGNTVTYVAYCFADVKGYSKFGSYRGNGNADGPFVYTGFRPAMIMLKKTSGTGDWALFDDKRSPFNQVNDRIYPNDSGAEESTTTQGNDFLSNGFKLRGTSVNVYNSGGDDYVYAAFAEFPLVSSNSKAGTAR